MRIAFHTHTPGQRTKVATFDAEHWISTENGSHILISGEGGNFKVIGGAGGKMNGNFIGPTSMSKARTSISGGGDMGGGSKPLTEGQRNDIARSMKLYQAHGHGKMSIGEFKAAARAGKFDHLLAEHEANEKQEAEAQKAEKQSKNEAWKAKNLPRLQAQKASRERAEVEAKRAKVEAGIARSEALKKQPEYSPESAKKGPIAAGHERFVSPLKIEHETEKAYGVKGSLSEAYKNLPSSMKSGRGAVKEPLEWLPKSHTSAHEGHVIGASGWLAKKNGYRTAGFPEDFD